jgi:nucleoside-diphosphate-sugar epimerase
MVFLTGGTGFLGGEVAHALIRAGARVRALVRNPDRAQYIQGLPGLEFVYGDLAQPVSYQQAIQGCQVVMHVGAALHGNLADQLIVNRDGTRMLANTAAEAGIERFVHVSTISVYGYRNTEDVTEITPPYPGKDPYGVSKLAGEITLRQVAGEQGLNYTIVRPGMIYGPRSGMWTGEMFKLARRRPTIFIGNGSGSCYPIHVTDVVKLLLLVAEHPAAAGETFNCTPDPSPTWREYLGSYSKLAGHQTWLGIPLFLLTPVAQIACKLAPEASPLRDLPDLLPFSQRYLTYKMTRARQLLNWQPEVTLEDGIASCADWLREKHLL